MCFLGTILTTEIRRTMTRRRTLASLHIFSGNFEKYLQIIGSPSTPIILASINFHTKFLRIN